MATPLPEPSGCGPGIPRPPDTPQEGVRSVRVRDYIDGYAKLFVRAHLTTNLLKGHDSDFAALARGFQECADISMRLHAGNKSTTTALRDALAEAGGE